MHEGFHECKNDCMMVRFMICSAWLSLALIFFLQIFRFLKSACNTDGWTDRRTDEPTDGQTLLYRYEDASKKEAEGRRANGPRSLWAAARQIDSRLHEWITTFFFQDVSKTIRREIERER